MTGHESAFSNDMDFDNVVRVIRLAQGIVVLPRYNSDGAVQSGHTLKFYWYKTPMTRKVEAYT
jgi:hypothetical protein